MHGRRMRQKPMTIKCPPFLCPLPQLIIVPTLPSKSPPQEALRILGGFHCRVSRTHDTVSQILKTVFDMMPSVKTEIEVFTA